MKIGQKAPNFKLKDLNGKSYTLADVQADYTVIYFYPKDDTPGCTLQAKDYTKNLAKFKKLNAEVIGISGGTDATKKSFCKKHGLKVLLLSDTDYAVSKKWGAWGMKSFMGRKYEGIMRNTYLLDKTGKILGVWESVSPEKDTGELLAAITTVAKGGTLKIAPKVVAKPAAKKALKTKVVAKKLTVAKPAMKKVIAKKAVATKSLVKKTLTKTASTKKPTAKKATPTKAVAKKAVVKKATTTRR